MKLVIGGSSGFVGEELVRQSLLSPAITSVVALSRRETFVPPGAEAGSKKLKSIPCDNFDTYSNSIRKELEDADACIWTIAVTPSKLKSTSFEEASKVSRDYALAAIQAIASLREKQDRPLRFIYISGHFAPRSRAEVPKELEDHALVDYGLMRGETEVRVLEYAEQSNGAVQSCIAKPGLIDAPGKEKRTIPGLPNVDLRDISAALLDQVINGFENDTLKNDDLVRIGQKALAEQQKA